MNAPPANRRCIHIEFLPGDAPELNPVEYLWSHWKQHELNKFSPALVTQVLGLLSHEGLITLERVMQDGTKVRAQAQAKTFCREDRIQQHLDAAHQHVQAMGDPEQEPASDLCGQVKLRAARERVEKLDRALKEIEKLRTAKMEDKQGCEPRVSITYPDARIMKTSDGGFAPLAACASLD